MIIIHIQGSRFKDQSSRVKVKEFQGSKSVLYRQSHGEASMFAENWPRNVSAITKYTKLCGSL